VVALACHLLLSTWWPRSTSRRVAALQQDEASRQVPPWLAQLARWRQRLHDGLLSLGKHAQRLSTSHPATLEKTTESTAPTHALRQRLLCAGIASPQATILFQASQALLALTLPLAIGVILWMKHPALQTASQLILLILSGMIGYHLPRAWLERRIRHRQEALFKHFPDALDLMRMCVQAGLGLDASIDRVGRETRVSCPALSDEFAMTGYELRAGAARAQALRHLAQRIDLRDVDAWVNTLIQSDRFGTNLSESLQVYAQALRHKRKLMAQEAAAKLPIKLLIPLVFCLFPGLLVVLLGPAIINISNHLLPVLGAQP
jgi:tight adherence protein C